MVLDEAENGSCASSATKSMARPNRPTNACSAPAPPRSTA